MDFKLIIGSKKTRYITLSFLILILLLLSECKDKNCSIIYNPITPIQILQVSDTIQIGDTLLIEGRMSSNLEDKKTGIYTNFSQFQFNFFVGLNNYNDTSKPIAFQPSALNSFEVLDILGSHTNSADGFFMSYIQKNDSINFKYLLITKDTGLFAISLFHFDKRNAHGGNDVRITSSNCKEYIEFQWTIFNSGKTNRNLIQNFDTSHFDRNQLWAANHSVFYFYVKPK